MKKLNIQMNSVFSDSLNGPIIVFGDSLIDSTLGGSCSRLANEGAIPVFVEKDRIRTLGGCGNVAANLRAMGADVILISVEGSDKLVSTIFADKSNAYMSTNLNTKTTIKTRGFADNKLVFRHDIEASHVTDKNIEELKMNIRTAISIRKPSCIVISDYNRDVCNEELCQYLIGLANKNGVPVVVDPKVSCGKYLGCTLIKPNLSEARRITGFNNIRDCHKELNKYTKARFTCITQASDGLSLYDHISQDEYLYKLPRVEVCDVTGAGDIVCATLAYCFAANICPDLMIKSAVFLATQSVKHAGSYVLKPRDFSELRCHLNPGKRISFKDLEFIGRGKKTVFTNGCFDIFHKGHVESLKEAKKYGDILVLGLNSDLSIRIIKGPERPIMDLDNRLAVLEAIDYVDYIIVFDEKTPLKILEALRPNVYVKGEEYRGRSLEGSQYADKIEYVNMKTPISTSMIISKIKETPQNTKEHLSKRRF
jgi:D-beta-D-heptose 7-phosphate kinase/D-beta-D-heptose 1-phosphate adenosyltransferase